MAGTRGALRLIERTTFSLCRALEGAASALDRAFQDNAGPAETAAAAEALVNQLQLWRAAWGPAENTFPLDRIIALASGLPNQVSVDVSALPRDMVCPSAAGPHCAEHSAACGG